MTIGIVTLGCDKNTVDNEYLAGLLHREGIGVVAAPRDPGDMALAGGGLEAGVDAVLINTCGFIEAAKTESIRTILSWVEHKKAQAEDGRRVRVFVAGCLTQRYRESLIEELPEVDGFMGVGDFEKVIALVRSPVGASSPVNLIQELPTVHVRADLPRLQLGPQPPHAFLKIADGCNHNCTFCAIPSFKGRLRSVAKEIVLAEARLLVGRGVREINIVAQDTSDYGKDLYGRDYGIADLLAEIAAIPGDFWIRLFYFYPGGLTERFLEMLAATPKICRYIDMPLQHLHPDVLRLMKRPHKDVNTLDAIARLRAAAPGMALRTTFIVGFPGETDAHFQHLMETSAALRFARMGAFAFSEEEGTPSATMTPRVPKKLRRQRLDALMLQQAGISRALHEAQVGTTKRVLVEGILPDGRWVARSESDALDVDGTVIITAREELKRGAFAEVRIVGASEYDLFAEV